MTQSLNVMVYATELYFKNKIKNEILKYKTLVATAIRWDFHEIHFIVDNNRYHSYITQSPCAVSQHHLDFTSKVYA